MYDIIKFKLITGGFGFIKVLFKDQIYKKLCDGKYKFIQMKCSSAIGVINSLLIVT